MPSIRQRVYTYLMLLAIPIISILYVNKIMIVNDNLNKDFRNIPAGTKLKLVCGIKTDIDSFELPKLTKFLSEEKIESSFGITYDYWSVHSYEVKINIASNPKRDIVPKGEFLVIGGPVITDIDSNGKVTYIVPLEQPQELSEIVLSSYIDHYVGVTGEIAYIFDTVYPNGLTRKEFDRAMVCINKIIFPEVEKENGKRR